MKSLRFRFFHARPVRLPNLFPSPPQPGDPRIFQFNSEREEIIATVTKRVVEKYTGDSQQLLYVLNDACTREIRRLTFQRDGETDSELHHWQRYVRKIGKMSEAQRQELLFKFSHRMAKDVAGNFDPRVFKITKQLVPGVLTAIMNPRQLPKEFLRKGWPYLNARIVAEGPIAKLRRLARVGTLVFVPTHSSNLDSIALGHVLEREGLPPVVYGAGKNLFTNPVISFFMHNLGAYRVDRRIQANLYKEILKTYSCHMIERGYHSLFFPGGTRSRSGMVEQQLKLGLAGTAVEAFARNQVNRIRRPVFFVPVTINYALVLEAESLIADYLKESGQARYIIDDDEFSQLDRMFAFFRKLVGLSSAAVIRFSEPIDPFCNPIDEEGHSLTPNGRIVDPGTYVLQGGIPTLDPARDAGYTRELGEAFVNKYAQDTVILWTHFVAHIFYRKLVYDSPGLDLFTRQRRRGEVWMTRQECYEEVGKTRDRLLQLVFANRVQVGSTLRMQSPEQIVQDAIKAWQGYHQSTVITERESGFFIEDPNLLLYYQNRLVRYAEELALDHHLEAAREIAAMGGKGGLCA